jgi:hypothetical protein
MMKITGEDGEDEEGRARKRTDSNKAVAGTPTRLGQIETTNEMPDEEAISARMTVLTIPSEYSQESNSIRTSASESKRTTAVSMASIISGGSEVAIPDMADIPDMSDVENEQSEYGTASSRGTEFGGVKLRRRSRMDDLWGKMKIKEQEPVASDILSEDEVQPRVSLLYSGYFHFI